MVWFLVTIVGMQATTVGTALAVLWRGRVLPCLLFAAQASAVAHCYRSMTRRIEASRALAAEDLTPKTKQRRLVGQGAARDALILGSWLACLGALLLLLRFWELLDGESALLLQIASLLHHGLSLSIAGQLPVRVAR
jgi:hypothetical protein